LQQAGVPPARIDAICQALGRTVPIAAQDSNAHMQDEDPSNRRRGGRRGPDVALPFVLARGCTVHRVQGQSLTKMIVSIGAKERPGVTHTAFGRGTSIQSMILLPPLDDTRLVDKINGGGNYGRGRHGKTAQEIVNLMNRKTAASARKWRNNGGRSLYMAP
jgi:hypothetical protein